MMESDSDQEEQVHMGNSTNRRGQYGPIPEVKSTQNRNEPMEVRLSSEMDHSLQVATGNAVSHGKWLLVVAGCALFLSVVVLVTYRSASIAAHSNDPRYPSAGPPLDDNDKNIGGGTIHPAEGVTNRDPWNIDANGGYGGIFGPPTYFFGNSTNEQSVNKPVGYFTHPDVHNDVLVFVAEGDVYATNLNAYDRTDSLNAMRITQTEGNALTPKVRPLIFLAICDVLYLDASMKFILSF